MTSRTTFDESISLLRTKRFGTFWVASLLSNIGTWAQQMAQPWLLLSLGASPFVIGLDSFALSAPVWFLTLVGGALADRGDRRYVRSSSPSARYWLGTFYTAMRAISVRQLAHLVSAACSALPCCSL